MSFYRNAGGIAHPTTKSELEREIKVRLDRGQTNLNDIDTSRITDMHFLFRSFNRIQNIDISLERTEELAKEIELNKYYNNVREITKERTTIDFNIEILAKDPTSGMWQTRDIIANHFSTSNEVLYVDSIPLTNYIFDSGVNNSSSQKIKLNDGTTKDIKIEKVRLDKKEKG